MKIKLLKDLPVNPQLEMFEGYEFDVVREIENVDNPGWVVKSDYLGVEVDVYEDQAEVVSKETDPALRVGGEVIPLGGITIIRKEET